MKFIKLPTMIASGKEIERSENLGTDVDWEAGYVLVNVDEIEEVIEGLNGDCSIFYKSGDSTRIMMELDDVASLLECK